MDTVVLDLLMVALESGTRKEDLGVDRNFSKGLRGGKEKISSSSVVERTRFVRHRFLHYVLRLL